MHFEYWGEGVLFIFLFMLWIFIPCVGLALIGYRMINKLGRFPSQTPSIQLSILVKLIAVSGFWLIFLFFFRYFD